MSKPGITPLLVVLVIYGIGVIVSLALTLGLVAAIVLIVKWLW